jgi:hypothetical protein
MLDQIWRQHSMEKFANTWISGSSASVFVASLHFDALQPALESEPAGSVVCRALR